MGDSGQGASARASNHGWNYALVYERLRDTQFNEHERTTA
jgi:hypothetical protein